LLAAAKPASIRGRSVDNTRRASRRRTRPDAPARARRRAAFIGDIERVAADRNWTNIRLLSSSTSTFKRDHGSELDDGEQIEHVSVFKKLPDGSLRHFYTKGAEMAPDQRERGIDLLSPVWHVFDLTPEGRGDWYPSFDYERGI
jgi:predicted dithiol-disulfide oxidoreductase (DUF899 family)